MVLSGMKQITITKAELQRIYDSCTLRDACRELGDISVPTLYMLLDKAQIPRHRKHKAHSELTRVSIID